MTEITLEAPDISCEHCIMTIEKAVTKLSGVCLISGDADSKRVTLEYNPATVDLSIIERVMEDEGYPVKR